MGTMKKGEVCILRAKPDYAYGDSGAGEKIPGGATLNFEVELFRWKTPDPTPGSLESNEDRLAYALKQKEAGNAAIGAGLGGGVGVLWRWPLLCGAQWRRW